MGCFGKYLQFRKASLSRKAVINTFVGLAYKLWKWKFFFPFKCFFHAQEMAFCWTLNDRTIKTIAKSAVYIRELFQTLLNIYDGAFYRNTYMWCFRDLLLFVHCYWHSYLHCHWHFVIFLCLLYVLSPSLTWERSTVFRIALNDQQDLPTPSFSLLNKIRSFLVIFTNLVCLICRKGRNLTL